MIYTEEQYRILQQATPHFESVKHEVIKNAPRWLTDIVADVLEEATGKKMTRNFGCNSCVYSLYRQAAIKYFADEKEYKKIDLALKKSRVDLVVMKNVSDVEPVDSIKVVEPVDLESKKVTKKSIKKKNGKRKVTK